MSKVLPLLLITIGVVGIIVSLVIYERQPKPPGNVKSVNVQSAPSSVKLKPQTIANYSVPPTNPKYIAIPAINIANTPILV
ncbi:MAG: hypothetical protein WDN66_00340 [Candidatus Saccharibacteria bacterium]